MLFAAVGYGDFHPETPLGKIFTSFFCLYGLTVVLAALAPIVDFLHGDWREAVMKAFGAGAKVHLACVFRTAISRSSTHIADNSSFHALACPLG